VRRELEGQRAGDGRIKLRLGERNGGISAASNAALELAEGEFIALLDHDDRLTPDALLEVADVLGREPQPDVVYSDSDKLTEHGVRGDPFFKPDWSPVYALGAMYVGHLLVVRRGLAERAGGFDSRFDTIQDFEFMLRVSELTDRIAHIPEILYHWRAIAGSIAAGTDQKARVDELQARAVTEHLTRLGADLAAVPHDSIPHRARLAAANGGPGASVSVIVCPRGAAGELDRCLVSIERFTELGRLEVIVADAADPARDGVKWVEVGADERGGPRAANRGAARASGDWLLFASDAIELVEERWLEALLVHAALPGVTAVGPLVVRPDGRADSAGIAIGLEAPAVSMLSGTPGDSDGYYGAMACARDVSAVSGEFMLVRADAFASAGGFNEAYAAEYHDADLCQRLRGVGGRIVYAPRPRVVSHELPARRRAREDIVDRALFVDCWYAELERGDPYFNPNLSRANARFVIEPSYPAGRRP
jgi:O-antigen biosynthesis protein